MSSPLKTRPLAAIFGVAGTRPTKDERAFFARVNPLGFILFERNCAEPAQVRSLVGDLRACVGRADAPVLIDQEGGRVQRLKPPHWPKIPPPAAIGALALRNGAEGREAARLMGATIAAELSELGITVDCAPVLDVPSRDAHSVIGDRAFANLPELVADLGGAFCAGLLEGGVAPVIKHIPGHGRARVDSHAELPLVDVHLGTLEAIDFAPFRALHDMPWAMTAHVIYRALDALRPATTSSKVIARTIRKAIGFEGMLISDDLSMKALSGSFKKRAADALHAGCDAVLHCNGRMDEMREVADGCRPLDDAAMARLARAASMVHPAAGADARVLAARLESLLGAKMAG
ncbi:MAG: beta-N-acetylhexosaminidase [Alphaproteobacteria bacterium]